MSKDTQEFSGPGFDELRDFLKATTSDSPEALGTKDVAETFGVMALMAASGGVGARLAADRRAFPGSLGLSGQIFADENALRARNNALVSRMEARKTEDPAYANTVDFLQGVVVPNYVRSAGGDRATKMRQLSVALVTIAEEVCREPYTGRHRAKVQER